MEVQNQNCSFEDHKNIDAIKYCQECNIYICNKCEKIHSGFFKNHHSLSLDKDRKEFFTGYCKEKNHQNKTNLVTFAKTIILFAVLVVLLK